MTQLLVLADDFTGALDCAVQFAKQGIATSFCPLHEMTDRIGCMDGGVLVVNTESRHLKGLDAYRLIHATVEQAMEAGVQNYYKKIDSVLRGNVAPELFALMDAAIADQLYLLPAFPKNGRTTVDGVQLVGGVPVQDTAFGQDPFSPVTESSFVHLLGQSGGERISVVAQDAPFPEDSGDDGTVYVFDAQQDSHLQARASQIGARQEPLIAAGCAGFAEFIPLAMPLKRSSAAPLPKASRLLVVSGSLSSVTQMQLDMAEEAGWPLFPVNQGEEYDLHERIASALREAPMAVLASGRGRVRNDIGRERMSRLLADTSLHAWNRTPDCALAVFGGDTLSAVMAQLGEWMIQPVGEVLPGVVLSHVHAKEREFKLISKSGGFGPPDVLMWIADAVLTER